MYKLGNKPVAIEPVWLSGSGIYTVTVIDFIGCSNIGTVTLTDVGAPIVSITDSTQVMCKGGSTGDATVTAFLGTSPYTYSWSTTPAQTNAQATGLMAGLYSVTVTDAGNCSIFISTTITEPTSGVTVDSTGYTDISCNGLTDGTAMVVASGGTSPLTYSWNTTPVQTNAMATGLGMGGYTVTVMDANGCSVMDSSVTITEPAVLAVPTSTTDATCGNADGSATAAPTGGTPPLSITVTESITEQPLNSNTKTV